MKKFVNNKFGFAVLLLALVVLTQCDKKPDSETAGRKEILGVSIGMSKDEAQRRLREVGQFERNERKQQEMWALPTDARYSRAALGYDAGGKVRYITAFARSQGNTTQIKYEDFGDLKTARQNVFLANVEYVWEIPARGDNPGYFVIARGFDPTYAKTASLMKSAPDAKEADEDDEKD